ncbi:hypothetical protein [Marinobacterium aestuariivivens]|uniref:Uncharacterized protein n=1 Tax=Marinobacterium aestuariivivens TaxID=1698799 RepID=A0ABW2A0H2_9GAMM
MASQFSYQQPQAGSSMSVAAFSTPEDVWHRSSVINKRKLEAA